VLTAALAGAVAGYGIAVPVGAIAVLIVSTAATRGLAAGLAAGIGTASADGIYASLAALFGAALGDAIAPWLVSLRVLAAAVLAAIGLAGLWRLRRATTSRGTAAPPPAGGPPPGPRGPVGTYFRFVGLTLLNPVTVIYFAALMVALPALGTATAERLAFAGGAFTASLSWQCGLAAVGAMLHRWTFLAGRVALSGIGYVIVLAFAVRIGSQALFG